MIDVLILGSGGHGRTLFDVLTESGMKVTAFVEPDDFFESSDVETHVFGVPVIRQSEVTDESVCSVILGVGQIKESSSRRALFLWARNLGLQTPPVISSSASLSPSSSISDAAQVLSGVMIGPEVHVGLGSIVNTGAQIHHGSEIGAFCHISTGVIINGDVSVGDDVFIGSGSLIRNGISISNGTFVPMGSVVTRDQ